MKLLYAEDEISMSEAVVDILQFHKYSVDAVYDGLDAFEYAKTGQYDGIILDIMMPKMNGLEVLCELRKIGVKTPILLLFLLGAINIANILLVSGDVERNLSMIADRELGIYTFPNKPKQEPIFFQRPKEDAFMSSNFFIITYDSNNQIINIDVSRIPSIDETEAKELAKSINNSKGRIGKFRYEVRENNYKKIIIFLDTSAEIISYVRVLLLSGALGLICWGFMLILVIILSKKAICPIAENIEKQKQFVTNAGHEIKTPLAIISANTEAMELYNGENKWTKNIKKQVDRLNGLMKNLLLLAKMEESKIVYQKFSLSEMASEISESFFEPISLKNIAFETKIQPDIILNANSEHIRQLFSILLDNAVKYTDENGLISLSVLKNDKNIIIKLENTCENLPNINPEKLFDRFYRADEARTQKTGGYGIGLSVAKAIVNAQNGKITANYIDNNKICFEITF